MMSDRNRKFLKSAAGARGTGRGRSSARARARARERLIETSPSVRVFIALGRNWQMARDDDDVDGCISGERIVRTGFFFFWNNESATCTHRDAAVIDVKLRSVRAAGLSRTMRTRGVRVVRTRLRGHGQRKTRETHDEH